MTGPNDKQWNAETIERELSRGLAPMEAKRLIIRPAVQRAMDEESRREEYRRMEFTQPEWHSAEAKEAWAERKPITRGGILLPLKDSDWWAMGYDAAMAEFESRYDFDANGW